MAHRDAVDWRAGLHGKRCQLACGTASFEPDGGGLWAIEAAEAAGAAGADGRRPMPDLPPMTRTSSTADYALGLPEAHLLELHRELARRGVATLAELAGAADGARLRVAGLVEVAQSPPTAKGIVFLGLDDETALANVVVFPDLAARHGALLGDCRALVIDGVVQRVDEVVSLRATRLTPLEAPAARPPRKLFR
jgi:error-prone DNA polymerase